MREYTNDEISFDENQYIKDQISIVGGKKFEEERVW